MYPVPSSELSGSYWSLTRSGVTAFGDAVTLARAESPGSRATRAREASRANHTAISPAPRLAHA